MLVVSRTIGSSSSATFAMTYGGAKSGSHCCWLMVKPTTVPSPETATCVRARLRQAGQIGVGGWTSVPQSAHPSMRRVPSDPEVQNHSLNCVSCGSGRVVTPAIQPVYVDRNSTTGVAAGNAPVTPELQ